MTNNRLIAKALRALARKYEQDKSYTYSQFTCVSVARTCGEEVEDAYRAAFSFNRGRLDSNGNESKLWNSEDIDDIRVMLLCMAAAMAETGDLT